jgi:hypothetical protein
LSDESAVMLGHLETRNGIVLSCAVGCSYGAKKQSTIVGLYLLLVLWQHQCLMSVSRSYTAAVIPQLQLFDLTAQQGAWHVPPSAYTQQPLMDLIIMLHKSTLTAPCILVCSKRCTYSCTWRRCNLPACLKSVVIVEGRKLLSQFCLTCSPCVVHLQHVLHVWCAPYIATSLMQM